MQGARGVCINVCFCVCETEREGGRGGKKEAENQRASLCETGRYCPLVDWRTKQGYSVLFVQT